MKHAWPLQSLVALTLLVTVAGCQSVTPEPSAPPAGGQPGTPTEHEPAFPIAGSTGPQIPASQLAQSPPVRSTHAGQRIEGLDIEGGIKVMHDNVIVKDVRITQVSDGPGQYALNIAPSNDVCPRNVVIEHVEVVGDPDRLAPGTKAVYGECPFTLRASRIIGVATGVRITDRTVLEGNYIHATFWEEGDDAHRSGIGLNGGAHNVIKGNTIKCEGPGCSGALVMYGDFARVQDVLVQDNLLATTGSYCTYAGSLDSKEFPVAKDVRYVGNSFSREFYPTCGQFGPVAGRDSSGGPGFVWEGNVWEGTTDEVTTD